jgi:hypothetical protein
MTTRIGYFVQHRRRVSDKVHEVEREYGQNYKAALEYARRASTQQQEPTYIVAYEEQDDDLVTIGHIAYANGSRIDMAGRMRQEENA